MKLKGLEKICSENRDVIFRFVLTLMLIGLLNCAWAKSSLAAPGELDTAFGIGGKATTSVRDYIAEEATAVAVQADGKIIVAGRSGDGIFGSDWDFAVVRYNPNGTLDTTFGNGGKVTTPVSDSIDLANSVAIQPDGKIVVAGIALPIGRNSDFAVVRYNADGSLDTTFDGDGKVITPVSEAPDPATSVTIQPDGKIILVGATGGAADRQDIAVVRYNPNGSLDTTLDGDGIVRTNLGAQADYAHSVVVQPDGKILVGGTGGAGYNVMPAVARYNSNGSLDTSFGSGGIAVIQNLSQPSEIYEIAIQPDGKIVGTGVARTAPETSILTVRYNADGALDTSFDNDGIIVTTITGRGSSAAAIAVQGNGKIVAAGNSTANDNRDFTAVRYNPNGSLDTGFGSGGFVFTGFAENSSDAAGAIAIQRDGKIVLAGNTEENFRSQFAVARYLGDSVNFARPLFDFDGDGKTDLGVYRSSTNEWWLQNSSDNQVRVARFGATADMIAPADFDGDGRADIAVFRPLDGSWWVLRSSNNSHFTAQFGQNGDLPRPADFDGDGKADITIFRPSDGTWHRLNSSDNQIVTDRFGLSGDAPLVADFDGDGKSDLAVWRASDQNWYWLSSSNHQVSVIRFGLSGDTPAVGDFDGDGKSDVSVFRSSDGTWHRLDSSSGQYASLHFGQSGDAPVVGDYDGDGKADIAVWRSSEQIWYRLNSGGGEFFSQRFGAVGDKPAESAFLPCPYNSICLPLP